MRKKIKIAQIIIMLTPTIFVSVASIFISGIQLKNIEAIKKTGDFATPIMVMEAKAECQDKASSELQKHTERNDRQIGELYERINKIYDFVIEAK